MFSWKIQALKLLDRTMYFVALKLDVHTTIYLRVLSLKLRSSQDMENREQRRLNDARIKLSAQFCSPSSPRGSVSTPERRLSVSGPRPVTGDMRY